MPFQKITPTHIQFFRSVLEEKFIQADEENLLRCASDQTEDLRYLPEIVLQPGTVSEVSSIMKYCNENMIPITPRGAGTGLSGGALPVHGGVSLDMKRFNRMELR